jgi:hypothetical protein
MLIIGIRGRGVGMDVAVTVEDMAGLDTGHVFDGHGHVHAHAPAPDPDYQHLALDGKSVGDLGDIISSCVDTPLRWPVAMSYGGGRALRSFDIS